MLIVIVLFNLIVAPIIYNRSVKSGFYGTFIKMTDEKQIGLVEVESSQIVFTNTDKTKVYRTGIMNDPTLTQRLYDSGAEFSKEIVQETSPIVTWLLPMLIFIVLGQLFAKKLMEKAGGGGNLMMFGLGKSNAKVYVPSSEGIRFSDVAGVDEAKDNLAEIKLPTQSFKIYIHRRCLAKRRFACGPSRDRKNNAGESSCRRSAGGPVFLNVRF